MMNIRIILFISKVLWSFVFLQDPFKATGYIVLRCVDFGCWTYCYSWKWYMPHRCQFLTKANNYRTGIPFAINFINKSSATAQRYAETDYPPKSKNYIFIIVASDRNIVFFLPFDPVPFVFT